MSSSISAGSVHSKGEAFQVGRPLDMSDVHAFVAVLKSEVAAALTTGLVAVEGRDYLSIYETERAAAAFFGHYNPDVSADDVAVLQVTLPPSCVIEGCGGHPFCFMTSYLPPENLRAIAQTTPQEEPSSLTTSPPPRKRLRQFRSQCIRVALLCSFASQC